MNKEFTISKYPIMDCTIHGAEEFELTDKISRVRSYEIMTVDKKGHVTGVLACKKCLEKSPLVE